VRLTNDELLLNRYVDGELETVEERALEERLAVDPGLRSKLADLIALGASIDIALSDVLPEEVATKPPQHAPFWRPIGIAVGIAVLLAGGAFVGIRQWLRKPPPPATDVLAQLDGKVVAAALRPGLAELASNPSFMRRKEIYESWADVGDAGLERLAFSYGPREQDPRARAVLYSLLPMKAVSDVDALVREIRANWSAKDLSPLTQLMVRASFQKNAEIESVLADVLSHGPDLDPEWLGEQLAWIQRAYAGNEQIGAFVTRALGDPSEVLQGWAALARASVRDPQGLEHAARLLKSQSADARILAATAIERHGTPVDKARLAALVGDPDSRVSKKAREVLANPTSESRQ